MPTHNVTTLTLILSNSSLDLYIYNKNDNNSSSYLHEYDDPYHLPYEYDLSYDNCSILTGITHVLGLSKMVL